LALCFACTIFPLRKVLKRKNIKNNIKVFDYFAMALGSSVQVEANLTVIGQAQHGGSTYNLIWD
jgi:hypothetical protein